MKNGAADQTKPHIVCLPYLAQGHITPMLNLAKLLHYKAGCHISFVNTHNIHQRLLKSGALPAATASFSSSTGSSNSSSSSDSPCFRFFSIDDGLPLPKNPNASQDIPTISSLINSTIRQPFIDLLVSELVPAEKQNADPSVVSLIIADAAMTFIHDVSREFGIPVALFWTASACALLGYAQYRPLIDSGIVPLKDSSYLKNGFLEKVVDFIPSMEGIRLKNLPSFIRTTDRDDPMLNMFIRRIDTIARSSAPLIIHTFDALEQETIQTLSTNVFPNSTIFPIGPLQIMLNNFITDNHQKELMTIVNSVKSNLWKEDSNCITWLDSKPLNSVIYVNFGSISVLPSTQVDELAWGLANSEKNFLWIVRPDLVVEGGQEEVSFLSQEFKQKVGERGFIQSWCDQERVLAHPSIGGFLTHCGWNSTLESLSCGVPVICWPFFADQTTNCWFCCGKWGVGLEFNDDEVVREDVERLVREVIDREKGGVMREKAHEWKRLAEEAATGPTGSSVVSFDNLVNQIFICSSWTVEDYDIN